MSVNSMGCTLEVLGNLENYLEADTGQPMLKPSWTEYPVPSGGFAKDIDKVFVVPLEILRREAGPTKAWCSGK